MPALDPLPPDEDYLHAAHRKALEAALEECSRETLTMTDRVHEMRHVTTIFDRLEAGRRPADSPPQV